MEKKTPFLQRHLDATQLSGLTNSNPVYFLVSPPRFGRIMRIVRPSGNNNNNGSGGSSKKKKKKERKMATRSLRDKEVWQFSHEDVKNGVIHFVADESALEGVSMDSLKAGVNDSFLFKLVAPGVQPAVGKFEFSVATEVKIFLSV